MREGNKREKPSRFKCTHSIVVHKHENTLELVSKSKKLYTFWDLAFTVSKGPSLFNRLVTSIKVNNPINCTKIRDIKNLIVNIFFI